MMYRHLLLHAVVLISFAVACLGSDAYTGPEEELPIDLRPLFPSKYTDFKMCRIWLPDPDTEYPAWYPEGMEVVYLKTPEEVAAHIIMNPEFVCKYAHIRVGGKPLPDNSWMHHMVVALWGRVEQELIIEDLDNKQMCKSLVGLKREHYIERERCRFGTADYEWCKCQRGKKPKNIICVPEDHKLLTSPSPLVGAHMTCVAKMGYRPDHLEHGASPKITSHRPYPTDPSSVKTAVLAYINSARVLQGTAETFKTWIPFFLKPREFHLFMFRETFRITEEEMIKTFDLKRTPGTADQYTARVGTVESPPIFLSHVNEEFPPSLNASILERVRPRCGCPPLCTGATRKSPDGFMVNGLRYVQGTSVFTMELFQDQRLRNYDFVIKLDWDIRFFKTMSADIMSEVVSQGAYGFHTGFSNNGNGCSKDTQRALDTYARSRNERAASAGDWLFENEALAWHSALFGVWTGLVYSPEYQSLINYLRNGEFGYSWFRYRWTDQSIWPKVVGYFHPDIAKSHVDLRRLRWNPNAPRPKSVFYHRKKNRGHKELCCGPCLDGVDQTCYKSPFSGHASVYIWCSRPPGNISGRIDLELCER